MLENINVKGKVTIKLVNVITNNIEFERTLENVMLENGAFNIIKAFTGVGVVNTITNCPVFDVNKNAIKRISGSWGSPSNTGTAWTCKFTAIDESTDSYTFRYLGLDLSSPYPPVLSGCFFAYDSGSSITKTSNQILSIEWTISAGYSSPP